MNETPNETIDALQDQVFSLEEEKRDLILENESLKMELADVTKTPDEDESDENESDEDESDNQCGEEDCMWCRPEDDSDDSDDSDDEKCDDCEDMQATVDDLNEQVGNLSNQVDELKVQLECARDAARHALLAAESLLGEL